MSILITGVAGFIGSNLANLFISQGYTVFGVDNLCRGSRKNISTLLNHGNFAFSVTDMTDVAEYKKAVGFFHARDPITEVWHLAANSDIPAGVSDPYVDLQDTFMTTFNTLNIMKSFGIKVLMFASSSAIYGDLGISPLFEEIGPLFPISNYGAMKLASEAAISASTESYLDRAYIFRFPNVIGVPATHGVLLDFVRKLKKTPSSLDVLGNGSQQKSYLHVEDLIDAMLFIRKHPIGKMSVFNIGADDEGVTVRFLAEEVVKVVSPEARINYGQDNKGWVGDVPRFTYSVDKLKTLGWIPKNSSMGAVQKAIQQIVQQESDTQ